MNGKYGKNEWKVIAFRVFGIVLLIILVLGGGYIFAKSIDLHINSSQESEMIVEQPQNDNKTGAPPVATIAPTTNQITNSEVMTEGQIENEILRIRKIWNADRDFISSNAYDLVVISQGVNAYFNHGILKMIEVLSGTNDIPYSRIYSYEDGKLIFAYFENSESHRLYFFNEKMFRWRYTPDITKNDKYNDYGNTSDHLEYELREEIALEEGYALYKLAITLIP